MLPADDDDSAIAAAAIPRNEYRGGGRDHQADMYDMRCRHFVTCIMRVVPAALLLVRENICARFARKTATPKKLSDVSKYVCVQDTDCCFWLMENVLMLT